MSKPKVETPVKKDPFDDMYSLANNSLTSKVNIAPKSNPFDDDEFTSGSTNFKSTAPADPAALFGGVKSQKAAEELFGGPDNSPNDFFGGEMGGGMTSTKAADDLFGGMDNNMYGGASNNMFGGMSQPKKPSNDFDFF